MFLSNASEIGENDKYSLKSVDIDLGMALKLHIFTEPNITLFRRL